MNPREYEVMRSVEDNYWWYVGMRRITRNLLPDLFNTPKARILDAGCGTGANLRDMRSRAQASPAGPERPATAAQSPERFICGLDQSLHALRFCIERGLPLLAQGSVEALPYASGSFDLVSCHDVLYCVPEDEKALAEFFRVLTPGGRLLVSVAALAALRGNHDAAVHGLRRYEPRALRKKLVNAGFRVERMTFANFFLFPAICAVRSLQRLFPQGKTSEDAASDFAWSPPFLNRGLTALLSLEATLISRFDLPVGVTLMAVARKPGSSLFTQT